MAELASVKVTVYGRVQGVFFRASTRQRARDLGLTGYARNLRDREAVEVRAEGEKAQLDRLIKYLEVGPPGARVERVDIDWSEYTGNYADFGISY
jgi:acylphosphatase